MLLMSLSPPLVIYIHKSCQVKSASLKHIFFHQFHPINLKLSDRKEKLKICSKEFIVPILLLSLGICILRELSKNHALHLFQIIPWRFFYNSLVHVVLLHTNSFLLEIGKPWTWAIIFKLDSRLLKITRYNI